MDALAAVLHEPAGPFTIERIEVAEPQAGEVRVAVKAVGICHSDLVIASGALGNPFPTVLGHEGAGVVDAVGEGVTSVKPGDKVLMSFNSCGHCVRCDHDDPAYCHSFFPLNMICARADGSTRMTKDGQPIADNCFGQSSFSAVCVANERNVLKVADDADLTTLAPLGCGIQTGAGAVLRSLKGKAGETLLVIGGGAVGLSAVIGGTLAGCTQIILIEPQAKRREMALEIGATHVIDPATAGNIVEAVRAIVPIGVDMIVDTSGHMPTLEQAPAMIAPMGRIGLVGLPGALDAALPLPMIQWLTLGGTVRGIVEGDSDITGFLPELLAYHAEGRLPFDKFVTRYPFEKINEAIADSHHGACIKPVLVLD
ncbi:NAD(P)-dependent alcohol dehydrogenase [Novosphingobium colocasiae]|uniref:NAD(P)-dependent alcohol dehydrogenase n=1 Tax=Novosphingobium colocasiae TaxID=1256513 RepID=UPI0035B1CC9E